MAASQSGTFSLQEFSDIGAPLVGGRLYTYVYGTTTHKTAYTDKAGAIPHTYTSDGIGGQYIALNARGELPAPLYLAAGSYDIALKDSTGATIWTRRADPGDDTSSALAADLASTSDASKGAGMEGFGATQSYNAGTHGKHSQMSGRLATDSPWLADDSGVADSKSAIQGHIDYMNGIGSSTSTVKMSRIPSGSYVLSSGLNTRSAGGQSGIQGDGVYSTGLKPSSDFTALTLATSVQNSGGFYIGWPNTAPTSTRVGVELADAVNQVSQCEIRDIRVDYSYRGFVANTTNQTIYLTKLKNLYSFRAQDWGFRLDAANGSTTLVGEQLYARCDYGGTVSGKGLYINNFTDVELRTTAVDQALNDWAFIQNANVVTIQNFATESCKISTPGASGVTLNSDRIIINGFKDLSNTYDVTAGSANVIRMGASAKSLSISGYSEQYSTVVAGTTKYKASLNAATSHLFVQDNSIKPTEVNLNGWFANGVFEGNRLTQGNLAPNYAGGWFKGQRVSMGAPVAGGSEGFVCTDETASAGVGTWVEFGNLKLQGSTTWDAPSVASGAQTTTTVTVTGAALGDLCLVSFSLDLQGMQLTSYVSSANTATVVLRNGTAGAIDLASGTLRVRVFKQ